MPEAAVNIIFGAFDRHNFGDMLFPHLAAALLPDLPLVFAGLATRDLRDCGGHRVLSLRETMRHYRDHPVNLIHAGGELLSCTAWQAAAMLLPPAQAGPTIAFLASRPAERAEFVQRMLGVSSHAPYVIGRDFFPHARAIVHLGVGGVELPMRTPALRTEVLACLRQAQQVGVRDIETAACLRAAGLACFLLPDPAVMVAQLFAGRIATHGCRGECERMHAAFPNGYLALQFSGEFGDDRTLGVLAQQLEAAMRETGLGIALFRAGTAPWHDELAPCMRLRNRIGKRRLRIFRSLDIWDICALIGGSRAYCGSSLHGRIVAGAFGLPRLNIRTPAPDKVAAYIKTWDAGAGPGVVPAELLTQALMEALDIESGSLHRHARKLAGCYHFGSRRIQALLRRDGSVYPCKTS